MSRIVESLYNSVEKYGIRMNEGLDESRIMREYFPKEMLQDAKQFINDWGDYLGDFERLIPVMQDVWDEVAGNLDETSKNEAIQHNPHREMNEDVNPMNDFEASIDPVYQREYREADDDLYDKVIQYVKTILSITDDVTIEDLKKEVPEYVYNIIDNM